MNTFKTNTAAKARYSAPRLSVYGEFANLTAAATGSVAEGNSSSRNRRI